MKKFEDNWIEITTLVEKTLQETWNIFVQLNPTESTILNYNVTVLNIDFGDKNYDGISIDNKTTNFNFGSLISARNV